jgi:nucleoside-diphosphate-sugar epimerase
MNILITGNMGYIGPVVSKHLRGKFPHAKLIGLDTCFFGHCLTSAKFLPERNIDHQYFLDVRDIDHLFLKNIDVIIHLAAISNDPIGNKFELITDEINHKATVNLAKKAAESGVKRFIFASSCSMYGAASVSPKKETDALNPISAYAKSKVSAEKGLSEIDSSEMIITALRFSTACGFSARTRLDLVLNDFVACAINDSKITVLSDGSPWRPMIDISDMALAMEWAITREYDSSSSYLAINVGADHWNFQVKDLAMAVAEIINNSEININKDAQPDKRSYRVNFELFKSLAPNHQPKKILQQSIEELYFGLNLVEFNDKNFRNSSFMRLKVLEDLIESKLINSELRWNLN